MSFLGLDIGTSAVKAVLVDDQGEQLSETSAPLNSQHPKSGWSEQNPDNWVIAVEQCCAALRADNVSEWNSVCAIGLSGQMHGATLLGKDQQPVRPAILWNDGRSAEQCNAINDQFPDIEIRAGIFAIPGFTAPKLLWSAYNEPDVFGQIEHVLLPKDYVRLALTGELETELADAAGTLWLNQASRQRNDDLCAASKTDQLWLPRLVASTEVSGQLRTQMAELLSLSTHIAVAGRSGDVAVGALGVGTINESDTFTSLGTSGQPFVSTETYRAAPVSAVHCYARCVPNCWFQMACMLNGASPMNWFANLANKSSGELLDKAETKLSFIGAIGGGSNSNIVLQTMCDAMGVSINRYREAAIGPAIGAARTAMIASGENDLSNVSNKPRLDSVFEARSKFANYHASKHSRWRKLYETLKPFAALNDENKEMAQ